MSEIPGFQEMMLPVLQILADGKEHSEPRTTSGLVEQ